MQQSWGQRVYWGVLIAQLRTRLQTRATYGQVALDISLVTAHIMMLNLLPPLHVLCRAVHRVRRPNQMLTSANGSAWTVEGSCRKLGIKL